MKTANLARTSIARVVCMCAELRFDAVLCVLSGEPWREQEQGQGQTQGVQHSVGRGPWKVASCHLGLFG